MPLLVVGEGKYKEKSVGKTWMKNEHSNLSVKSVWMNTDTHCSCFCSVFFCFSLALFWFVFAFVKLCV